MTVKKALALIKKYNPTSRRDFEKLGFKLKFVNSGAFRVAYKIVRLPLIVKFSLGLGADHSQEEITHYKRISKLKKYKKIRRYLPKIYWWDFYSGVIVMKYYKVPTRNVPDTRIRKAICSVIEKGSNDFCDWGLDIYTQNIGYEETKTGRKSWKVIDLGCFES